MKELSIEEKAKAYDKVLEWATEAHKVCDGMLKEDLEHLFPELKESEDERIRKAILELVRQSSEILEKKNQEQMIAWLEKQRKNNMGISEATKKKLEDNLNKALEKETPESFNKFLDEQKPTDNVEPKFKAGDRVIGIVSGMQYYITEVCDDCYYTESGCTIMFYAQDNFELSKQNPAWSEEDKKMSRFIGNAITAADASEYLGSKGLQVIDAHVWLENLKDRCLPQPKQEWSEEDEKMYNAILRDVRNGEPLDKLQYDWLKSLKDRVQPQPKQEWSMYDETILKALIDHFEYKKEFNEAEDYDIVLWLKSLRPQNTWKPSDEQMDMLAKVCSTLHLTSGENEIMESIYDALKKLKG